MKIQLNYIANIYGFSKICSLYEGQILVKQGVTTVNAKSVMGLYSVDLSQPIEVVIENCSPEDKKEFYQCLKKWEVPNEEVNSNTTRNEE